MRKKIAWLPYDFDTAIGINNEGSLVFGYSLEDTDHIEGGADVFNGQDSVIWNNIRDAFRAEIAAMYQELRSTGALSYDKVEQMFEAHQAVWPEALFNEDSEFKYIDPLTKGTIGADGKLVKTGAYLAMLQGSKAEQRKWWLYNRFRYIDSKYNAGDALSDLIQLRGYAKADITVKPYADIYPTIKYGSYLVSARGKRGTETTLVCPLDNVNDTEIYIYSSSQLASVGDLSGLKVGFADLSMGTKLQEIKLGDADSGYDNPNLGAGKNTLTFGSNTLLKKVDIRNCSALGTGDQKTVDLSGCVNIEEAYFDGTAIRGLTLPNGGVLRVLHLPGTMANLTIRNQKNLADFVIPGYSNISTLWLENNSAVIDTLAIVKAVPANTRVHLVGVAWEAADAAEIRATLDLLDTMRGLDEFGNNQDMAYVSGTYHTSSLTGEEIAEFESRYPYLHIIADHTTSYLTFANHDGTETIDTVECFDGAPQGDAPAGPSRASTAQYDYTFAGWSKTMDAETPDADALVDVLADRTVYAAYSRSLRSYTVTWKNYDNTVLETDTDVPYGTTPTYDGATPTYDGMTSTGWTPEIAAVTGDAVYTATYPITHTVTFVRAAADGGGTLATAQVAEGSTPVYSGETPTTTQGDATDFTFTGWSPALAPIYADTTYTAVFTDNRSLTVQYLTGGLKTYESDTNTSIRKYGLSYLGKLKTVRAPLTSISANAFDTDYALETVDLTSATTPVFGTGVFAYNRALTALIIRSAGVPTIAANTFGNSCGLINKDSAVFVTDSLVSQYKAHSIWKTYNIFPVSEYDLNGDRSTIRDSWSEILAAEQDGTYSTKYAVGDTKRVLIGDEYVYMQIAAFDADELADGTGNAKITWVSYRAVESRRMHSSTSGGGSYINTELADYLENSFFASIEPAVSGAIKSVSKTSSTDAASALRVWAPSAREVMGTGYESTGPIYSALFSSAATRKKVKTNGNDSAWWLRSPNSATYYRVIKTDGAIGTEKVTSDTGLVVGFCT